MNHDEGYGGLASMTAEPGTTNYQEIDYKYGEDRILAELDEYIRSTYEGHYQSKGVQVAELIYEAGHGTGFNVGNVLKYAARYGKKGSRDDARKDMIKVIHYAMLQLYLHDKGERIN